MAEREVEGPASRSTLGTIRNGTRLLQILGAGAVFLPLSELSEQSGMSLSTTHRVVRSLVEAGLVSQDPRSSRYSLGPEIVRLSEGYLARLPVLRAVAPYLVQLRMMTHGTVMVALLMRTSVLYADRVDAEEAGGIFREGRRLHDALETAAGRVLIARSDEEAWAEAVAGSPLGERFTDSDRACWRDAPHLVLEPGDFRPGVEVAVPVTDGVGKTVAALAAVGDPSTLTGEIILERVVPVLQRVARAAGEAVGGH